MSHITSLVSSTGFRKTNVKPRSSLRSKLVSKSLSWFLTLIIRTKMQLERVIMIKKSAKKTNSLFEFMNKYSSKISNPRSSRAIFITLLEIMTIFQMSKIVY